MIEGVLSIIQGISFKNEVSASNIEISKLESFAIELDIVKDADRLDG